jgi:hypothetical protein
MSQATQPRMARGTKLPATMTAAALFALLAFAPLANAAPDPVGSGSATITLKKGFTNTLKSFGIKVLKVSPAKLKGQKLTLTVTGGEVDPLTGKGKVTLGGGLKFKAGKKTAAVKGLEVNTTKKGLFAKVAGKKMKLASVGGYTFARAGFGVSMTIKKLKLTTNAAKQLNKKTGYAKGKKPFLANKLMASAKAEEQPATVTIMPGGNVDFNVDNELLKKLENVEAFTTPIAPSTEKGKGKYEMPITGGSIAPDASAGVVQTGGGLQLNQKLTGGPTTEITLGNFYVDLSAKTITVEVVAKSNAKDKEGKEPLNLGNLGRSSIADVTLTGATVTADATTHTVTVKGASATLQPISAEVLSGFVSVYQGYAEFVAFQTAKGEGKTDAEAAAAAKAAGEEVAKNRINAGDPLGVFSFTAQTQ